MHSPAERPEAVRQPVPDAARPTATRLLLVSDRDDDFTLLNGIITGYPEGAYALEWVPSIDAAVQAGEAGAADLILADYILGEHNAAHLVEDLRRMGAHVPVIVLGTGDGGALEMPGAPTGSVRTVNRDSLPLVFELVTSHMIAFARLQFEHDAVGRRLLHAQRMEAVGQLARGVAHDFNNLLTAILCYADLGLSTLPTDDSNLGNLKEIQEAAQRAAGLTRQLLAFSKKQYTEPAPTELNELLLGSHAILKRLLGSSIELVTIPADGPVTADADPGQVEQVVFNLAMLSRDAMPHGGKLVLQPKIVQLSDGDSDRLGLRSGDWAKITIVDNGAAASAEHVARATGSAADSVDTPAGLGLSTCMGLVRQNGGAITVESRPDEGTTFCVYLPLSEGGTAPTAEVPGSEGTEKVLVVDDDDAVRDAIAVALRARGYEVMQAGNATDALRTALRATERPFDLLITDVVMPLMSGTELAARLRSSISGLRVIYTSGYVDLALPTDRLVGVLGKPFTTDAIARKVRDTLDMV